MIKIVTTRRSVAGGMGFIGGGQRLVDYGGGKGGGLALLETEITIDEAEIQKVRAGSRADVIRFAQDLVDAFGGALRVIE